jgi:hypothetical protein
MHPELCRGYLADGIVWSPESRSFGLSLRRQQYIRISRRGMYQDTGAPDFPKVGFIPHPDSREPKDDEHQVRDLFDPCQRRFSFR